MNDNMNGQNNQGVNNILPNNGMGTFVNTENQQNVNTNMNQVNNASLMNNNFGGTNNMSQNPNNLGNMQPSNYASNNLGNMQPSNYASNNLGNMQPSNHTPNNLGNMQTPNHTPNNLGNMQTPNYTPNNLGNMQTPNYTPNNNAKKDNKKVIKIAAIAVGAVLLVVLLIVLLSKSSSSSKISTPSAKRTLTCTTNVAMFGVYYDETYEYYINDGSVALKQIQKIDLKKNQIQGSVDDWVKEKTDSISAECNAKPGCEFDYKYSKGNYLETIVFMSEEMLSKEVQGLTADQIYDKQKSKHENAQTNGLVYTCSGNGQQTSVNTQSVYKTIDFSSYSGNSKSTEFNDLIGKKVTFTNVPTLGGTLGNMSKTFYCSNKASLTIEDNTRYTLTGVVTDTIGTYNVSMKDCSITKN